MTRLVRPGLAVSPLTCAFRVERVTGIEPALSAWELDCHASLTGKSQVSHHRSYP